MYTLTFFVIPTYVTYVKVENVKSHHPNYICIYYGTIYKNPRHFKSTCRRKLDFGK